MLRHFYSREELPDPPLDSWQARFGAAVPAPHHPVAPAPSSPSVPVPVSDVPGLKRWSPGGLGLAAAGCASALMLSVLVTAWAVYGLGSEDASAPQEGGVGAGPNEHTRCTAALSGLELADSLPQLFSGAPIRWGSRVSELEAACEDAPPAYAASCLQPILDLRAGPWQPHLPIPHRNRSTLAFHREHGFFEVMVYSNAASGELLSVVQSRLGPPHRSEGPHQFWEYPRHSPTVRVKVSPLVQGHREGRSAIKAVHVPVSTRYWEERRVLCAR